MARVPELVATTLDRLATQASLHARGNARESYIPIGQLRDDVLRFELQGRRREELWRRVRDVVEGNANIRAATREGRGGDFARVWEWIGGISSVPEREGSSAYVSGRESSKVQLPVSADGNGHDEYQQQSPLGGIRASRVWDEGRPIY